MPRNQGMPSKKKVEENVKKNSVDMTARKIPHLSLYLSNRGPVIMGTPSLVEKFRIEIKEWDAAMISDQEFLNNNIQENRTTLATEKGNNPPPLLPADLSLMRFRELTGYLKKILLRNHWASGGKSQRVIPGHPDFQAPFWPEDIWPWHQVNKPFQNMGRKEFPGTGNLTEFMKKVVQRFCEEENIDAENHVTTLFTDQQRKRRQKFRSLIVNSNNDSSNSSTQNIHIPENHPHSSSIESEESVVGEIRRKRPEEMNQTRDDSIDLSDLDRSNIAPLSVPNNMEVDDNVSEDVEDVREGVEDVRENMDAETLEEQMSPIDNPSSDADITLSDTKNDRENISFEKDKNPYSDLQQSFNPDRILTSTFKGTNHLEELLENVEFIIRDDTNVGLVDHPVDLNNSIEKSTPKLPSFEMETRSEDNLGVASNQGQRKPSSPLTSSLGTRTNSSTESERFVRQKKCRAKFGIENKQKWCKGCKNKKKCLLIPNDLSDNPELRLISDLVRKQRKETECQRKTNKITSKERLIVRKQFTAEKMENIFVKERFFFVDLVQFKVETRRHMLFCGQNQTKNLNLPENQVPSPFTDEQDAMILRKCLNFFEEVNGYRATTPQDTKYLSYVIIPETCITIFKHIKNLPDNGAAEHHLCSKYKVNLSDIGDSD